MPALSRDGVDGTDGDTESVSGNARHEFRANQSTVTSIELYSELEG
jgi:hypothetical protein